MASNSSLTNLFRGRFDSELNLWDAGSAVTAGATATSTTIDLAGGTPYVAGSGQTVQPLKCFAAIVDFTVLTTTGGTDTLTVRVQFSNAADFGSGVVTTVQRVYVTGDTATAPRRCILPAISQDHETNYRYVRVQVVSANNGAGTFGGYIVPIEG